MIFTPEERRALLTVVTLLLLGQAISYWDRYRRSRPDRDLSRWLTHLALVRAGETEGADSLAITKEFLAFIEEDAPPEGAQGGSIHSGRSPHPAPAVVEPLEAAPPGILETGRLRINEATAEHLETLPGIGPALAGRILAARSEALFRREADLLRVSGIGPKKLERLQGLLDFTLPQPSALDSLARPPPG